MFKKMMSSQNSNYNPIAAGVAYTFGNMLIKAIPFVTLPLFTRILSTADFGLYTTYLSYESIFTILLGFGFSGTVRVAKIEFKDHFEKYISAIISLQIILSLILDVLFVFLISGITQVERSRLVIFAIMLANCLCSQLYNIISAKYAINGEVSKNLSIAFAVTFFNVSLSLLLCKFVYEEQPYLGRIWGTFAAEAIVAVLILFLQYKKERTVLAPRYWKFGLRMGAPLIMHSLSLTFLSQCDKIMIQAMVGDSEAGIYGIAVTMTSIASVLVNSIDNAWAPWFFRKLEKDQYQEIYKSNNSLIIMFTMIIMLISLVSPEIIKLMSASDYWESIDAFPVLLISVLFNFYYLIPVNFEYYHKRTGYIAVSTVIIAIVNVVLNIVFIRSMGYIGAAYATSVSKLLLLLMHWLKAWRLDPKKLMGVKTVFVSSFVAIMICGFTIIFKNMIFARFVAFAALTAVCGLFIKRAGYFEKIRRRFERREQQHD